MVQGGGSGNPRSVVRPPRREQVLRRGPPAAFQAPVRHAARGGSGLRRADGPIRPHRGPGPARHLPHRSRRHDPGGLQGRGHRDASGEGPGRPPRHPGNQGLSDHGVIATDRAPGAIGPYSQAVRSGDLVFCSGQIPLDPMTGQLVEGGIGSQTTRALANLAAVLAAADLKLANVVKTTVFLVSMGDFPALNEGYALHFDVDPPARSTVAVAALPKGALVEIDAIASA